MSHFAGKVLSLFVAHLGSIPIIPFIPYGPMSWPGMIPECRVRKTHEHYQLWPKNKKLKIIGQGCSSAVKQLPCMYKSLL